MMGGAAARKSNKLEVANLLTRVGLAVGLCLLAGVLLTVSIAVSAETARPPAVSAPAAAELSAPAPAIQAGQRAPEAEAQAGQAAPVSSASPSKVAEGSKGFPLTKIFDATGAPDPAEAVRRTWQRARDAGAYHFATDLVQLLYPAHSVASAGSTPQREELHLEGNVDVAAQAMNLKLWQGGGSVAGPGDARKRRERQGVHAPAGQRRRRWRATDSSSFAPRRCPALPASEREAPPEELGQSSRSTSATFTFDWTVRAAQLRATGWSNSPTGQTAAGRDHRRAQHYRGDRAGEALAAGLRVLSCLSARRAPAASE
jgi:hypothetical protein